jgi:transcription elongation GreA/GreB family factor
VLTGHGRTVLSRRLVDLRRGLAATARRYQEIEQDRRLGSAADLDELRRRVLALGREINQLEALLELTDHPELKLGETIGPETVVGVVDATSGRPAEYRLVGCEPHSDSTVISVNSPIGQALSVAGSDRS